MPPSGRAAPLIYVADDDAAMREVVASTLAAHGYHVWQARDGRELLDRLLDRVRHPAAPALVISDVAMPFLTGPAACLAARAAGVDVPFIFMTAFVSSRGRKDAEAAGATDILDKPFEMEELVAAVRRQVPIPNAVRPPFASPSASRTGGSLGR